MMCPIFFYFYEAFYDEKTEKYGRQKNLFLETVATSILTIVGNVI